MLKYIVKRIDAYTNEVLGVEDEFDNKDNAEIYLEECRDSFAEGAEVLELAGRGFTDPDNVDFIIEEIND